MVCILTGQIICLYQSMYLCYKNDHSDKREIALLQNVLIFFSLFKQRIKSFVLQKKSFQLYLNSFKEKGHIY